MGLKKSEMCSRIDEWWTHDDGSVWGGGGGGGVHVCVNVCLRVCVCMHVCVWCLYGFFKFFIATYRQVYVMSAMVGG